MKLPTNEIPAAAAAVLEHADHFELLSLDPHLQIDPAKNQVAGYKVLGTAVINDPETRSKLVSAFEKAVAENDGVMAACFNPRHEIRVTQGKKHVYFVICFECDQVKVGGDVSGEFLITNSAEPLFNSVLRSNGIPGAAP